MLLFKALGLLLAQQWGPDRFKSHLLAACSCGSMRDTIWQMWPGGWTSWRSGLPMQVCAQRFENGALQADNHCLQCTADVHPLQQPEQVAPSTDAPARAAKKCTASDELLSHHLKRSSTCIAAAHLRQAQPLQVCEAHPVALGMRLCTLKASQFIAFEVRQHLSCTGLPSLAVTWLCFHVSLVIGSCGLLFHLPF